MAVPTIFEDHFSRWSRSSSSSFSNSSSTSRSTSSTGFTDCPTMSKSLTDSMSSDTQTENETPPESPMEDALHLETTPIIYNTRLNHIIICPRICDYDSDAGYETECEDRHPMLRPKRIVKRRKALDRTTFRKLGDPSRHLSASGAQSRTLPSVHTIPSAPLLGSTPRIAGQSLSSPSRRKSISRPGGPNNIALPEPSPPVFPSSGDKASIGLGLGLGLPSTLSDVQRAPNCVHRSGTDPVPSPMRSLAPVTHAELLLPFDDCPLPPTPLKPRLNPFSPPPADEFSPLDLAASSFDNILPSLNDGTTANNAVPFIRPRHAAFSFSGGAGRPADFSTFTYGPSALAFLTIANHAQTQQIQLTGPGSRQRIPKGPPTRGLPLPSTQEEVCPGDEARGIRRFAAMNPYFASMGYCVSSG